VGTPVEPRNSILAAGFHRQPTGLITQGNLRSKPFSATGD
jgi:hypothetical protein